MYNHNFLPRELLLPPPSLLHSIFCVTFIKWRKLCWSHAHLLHRASSNNLFVCPAGTRRRGASPLGSAASAAKSKECSRARPWREPCCRLMGWWRERMTWWDWCQNIRNTRFFVWCKVQMITGWWFLGRHGGLEVSIVAFLVRIPGLVRVSLLSLLSAWVSSGFSGFLPQS